MKAHNKTVKINIIPDKCLKNDFDSKVVNPLQDIQDIKITNNSNTIRRIR